MVVVVDRPCPLRLQRVRRSCRPRNCRVNTRSRSLSSRSCERSSSRIRLQLASLRQSTATSSEAFSSALSSGFATTSGPCLARGGSPPSPTSTPSRGAASSFTVSYWSMHRSVLPRRKRRRKRMIPSCRSWSTRSSVPKRRWRSSRPRSRPCRAVRTASCFCGKQVGTPTRRRSKTLSTRLSVSSSNSFVCGGAPRARPCRSSKSYA